MFAMFHPGKLTVLAASLRLPNLPSVWSNVLTGCIVACYLFENGDPLMIPWALVSATALYLTGNLLNDWADLDWDRKYRPERALPSGQFTRLHYLQLSIILVTLGLIAALGANAFTLILALLLLASILLYTLIHKRTAWSVIPMACCRALLPLIGYSACVPGGEKLQWLLVPASLLFVHLVLLSLRARSESRSDRIVGLLHPTSLAFLLPPLVAALYWYLPHQWTDALLISLVASLPYLTWVLLTLSLFRHPVSHQVSALLAGIPLVDALFLLPYALMGFLFVPSAMTWLVAMAWLPAFLLGRLLQRWIPAT